MVPVFSAIAEYDQTLLSQCYANQKKASEYKRQAKEFAADLQDAEENWAHDKLDLEDLKARATGLETQLDELRRQQREITASAPPSETNHRNYRSIGINLSELLKGTDPNEYREKLETDEPLYPNDKRKVRYALSQMKDSIFDVMHSWVFDVGNELTLELFFKEIENYMGIHHQKKNAKKELLTIKMNKTESVSEYYHRLFKLWQRAGTSLEDRIDMFIGSVSPGISNALQAREYKDFTKLLEDARRVEGYRKDVVNNFYSRKDKPEKTSRSPAPGRGAPRTTLQTAASKTIASDAKTPHPNDKFGPVSKKPEGWVGVWYDGERNPEKLTSEDRDKLAKQSRCWSCRGSGHRGNDAVCINADRRNGVRLNRTAATPQRLSTAESDVSSDSEKE